MERWFGRREKNTIMDNKNTTGGENLFINVEQIITKNHS